MARGVSEMTTDTINHLQTDVTVLRDQRGALEGRALEAEKRLREVEAGRVEVRI